MSQRAVARADRSARARRHGTQLTPTARRIPPRAAARAIRRERQARFRLYRRLGLARRHQGARLFRVRARAACRTDSIVVDQSRLRAQPDARAGARQRSRSSAICAFRNPAACSSPITTRRARPGSCATTARWQRNCGWGDVAPFYIDQESPVPPGGVPKPGPLKRPASQRPSRLCADLVRARGGLAAVFGVWAVSQRRKKA